MSATTGKSLFAFDTEDYAKDVLNRAAMLKRNDKMLLPYFKVGSFKGIELFTIQSRPLNSDEDFRQSLFEVFSLLNCLRSCYACFYYVPLSDDDSGDIISLIQIDTARKSFSKENYKFNSVTLEWDSVDPDIDMDLKVGQIPINILQALVSALGVSHTNSPFPFTVVKDFLTTKGYIIDMAEDVDSDTLEQSAMSILLDK